MKKILHALGSSDRGLSKALADALRMPVRIVQWQLLKVQKDPSIVRLIQKIFKEKNCLMWPTEMMQVYHCASSVKKLSGDFAEVGVFQGRSAKVIAQTKGSERSLHLFDTFAGLPQSTGMDDSLMRKDMYASSLHSVKDYLDHYQNVFFYPGLFPETAAPVQDRSFAFVHLDVDLHQSTLKGLEFFYPRMVRGGIILSHDYSILSGVKKAFDEFFNDKPENVLEFSTSQCMIVKQP